MVALFGGYAFYGRFLARQYRLDDAARTPAEKVNDGIDFVPTNPFYLLSQHFSAIAAAGPIVGPIAACLTFGWLPCLVWIVLGVVLIGAVHDFSALIASIRHGAKSVAEIVKQNIGTRAWLTLLAFIWIALLYVIVAFTDVTAETFLGRIEELDGVKVGFEKGGAVAAASTMYLLLAVVLGVVQKRFRPPLWLATLIFVPATLGAVWLGTQVSTGLLLSHRTWVIAILAYCFVASLLPVWLLLQPRGYLGGFVLYLALAVGVVGIFFGGFEVKQPAFRAWTGPKLDAALFPFLFVTIACGACSGFHGLVCSGTTSKQIARESHCRPVGYGGMLLEGFVAVIALATVMMTAKSSGAPGAMYGEGIGRFLTVIIGKDKLLFAIVFGSMAFSTFVFDTLDVATRLGRYILQELFGARGRLAAVLGTLATVGFPLVILLSAGRGSWKSFWILFGTSNQLLAALTLLAVTVWLKRSGRRAWFVVLPMLFVMTITMWSLVKQIVAGFSGPLAWNPTFVNGAVATLLCLLALHLVAEAAVILTRRDTHP